MGIQSLKSAILYSVSLYFHLHRINIVKKTTSVHENTLFRGRKSNFCIPIHQNL